MAKFVGPEPGAPVFCGLQAHQARGADNIITSHIDAHVEAERRKPDDDDGAAGVLVPVGSWPVNGQQRD